MRRLQEVYFFFRKAAQYVYEVLLTDICDAKVTDDQAVIVALLRGYVMRECQRDKELLDIRFDSLAAKPPSVEEFQDIMGHFSRVLNGRYPELVSWYTRTGELILGRDRLISSTGYKGLLSRHNGVVREILRVKDRPDIGGIASWSQTLYQLLPPPSEQESLSNFAPLKS